MIICFDVDGTIINMDNTPRYEIIDYLRLFLRDGNRIIIWSGGGQDYARNWADKLGFDYESTKVEAYAKNTMIADIQKPDICFDDEFVDLAKINIKV